MEVRRDILWRVYLSFIGISVLGFFVLGKAFLIQRVEGNHWRSMSDSLHQRFVITSAERGTIYSEDGQMLSTSIPSFDVYLDLDAEGLRENNGRRFHENLDSLCLSLSDFFRDKPAAQYRKELLKAYRERDRYFLLKKKLSFDQYRVFRDFPLVRLGRNRGGVIIETNSRRLLPFGLLANRTIGLSREHISSQGKLRKQNVGLEKSYDSVLTGRDGRRLVRFIAGGTAIPVEGYQIDPVNGKDVFTTIDVNIQDITETALMNMLVRCEAEYGTAVVMETATGKIKAIANLGRRPDGSYWEDDNYALRVTEPGSTIKLATLLAVLEKGKATLADEVEVGTQGSMEVGPRVVNDAERSPKAVLSVKECFAHSSNVGMSKLAFQAFGQKPLAFRDYLHRYFLDTRPQIDLTDVPSPRLAPLEQRNGGLMNMITMSFGYAIQVSPVQTLALYNAVANNGRMMKPYLVNSIQSDGIVYRQVAPQVLAEQISSPDAVRAARECMEAVVTEGTGKLAFAGLPFRVAGKTGTAHVADGPVKYAHRVYQASFAGYFPAERPQFSCIVVIRTKPHAYLHYGGQLAAPVFREIASRLYATYVVSKQPSSFAAHSDSSRYLLRGATGQIRTVLAGLGLSYHDSAQSREYATLASTAGANILKPYSTHDKIMPDVKGMGLRDAVLLLEQLGLKVIAKGKGKIVRQSVPAGTVLAKGITVMLEMS